MTSDGRKNESEGMRCLEIIRPTGKHKIAKDKNSDNRRYLSCAEPNIKAN